MRGKKSINEHHIHSTERLKYHAMLIVLTVRAGLELCKLIRVLS